jgi:5S rRNA maturation endonuclease (ribonuclease M5)
LSGLERRLDRLTELVKRLSDQSRRGTPIVVEGRKDEGSLRELGINGPILCLKAQGKSFFEFLESIGSNRKVIVLTDFDAEGKKLAKMLVNELSKRRIKVDDSIWRQVGALVRQDIHTVQELGGCIEGMQRRVVTAKENDRQGKTRRSYMSE